MQSDDKLITFTRSWIRRWRSQTIFFKNALFRQRHTVSASSDLSLSQGHAPAPRWRNHKSHLKTKLAPPTL